MLSTHRGLIVVTGPVSPEEMTGMQMEEGLKAFRPPARQKQALMEIADLPEGRVYMAISGETIVGYVTFHAPEEFERWGQGGLKEIIELGAIEVSPAWRHTGTGAALLEVAFGDEWVEDHIVIACEYCWHWDLKGTGLSIWEYRRMMERLLSRVGMDPQGTDDPEICEHPANMLVVRVGSRVDTAAVQAFDMLRYQKNWMYV
ncbi:hypothetical protein SY88_21170 [Clostridiales bacterium PH28_bin88]|nr:hypothetical protein SY88_21170 [Clostridiales bacterium PH28_bin88]